MPDARQVAAYEEALYRVAAVTVRTRKATRGFTVPQDAARDLLVECEAALSALIALDAIPTPPGYVLPGDPSHPSAGTPRELA